VIADSDDSCWPSRAFTEAALSANCVLASFASVTSSICAAATGSSEGASTRRPVLMWLCVVTTSCWRASMVETP
jgi:hypothetical protein